VARYSSTAINALYTALNSGIAAKLTTVETENSLAAGALPSPIAVLKRYAPYEQRYPRIEIFEENADPDGGSGGQRCGQWRIGCKAVFTYKSDADLDTHEVRFRLYVEALIRVLLGDDTLGGLVISTIVQRVEFRQENTESTTVHQAAIDLLVLVQSTTGG